MLPSTSRYIFSIALEKCDPTLIDSGIMYDTCRGISYIHTNVVIQTKTDKFMSKVTLEKRWFLPNVKLR